MNYRGFILPVLFLLLIASCKTSKFEVKDGKTARELLLYNESIDFLLKEFNNAKDLNAQQRAATQLGDSYRKFADYSNAEKWYKQAVDLNTGEIALLNLGLMQKQQEKYEDAARTFDQYQKLSGTSFEGRKQLKECRDAVEWKRAFSKVQARNLSNLNSSESDYAPGLYKNNALVFTSARSASTGDRKDGWTGEKFTDIWMTNSESENLQNFGPPINTEAHESSATFTADFKEMFFVRCKPEEFSNQYCSIYYSAFNNGHWNEPAKLDLFPDSVNVYDPFISRDGKYLLVAANPKENFGETDLYVVAKADSGWSAPQNLGGGINTPKSERSPWLDEKGNLYYSSSGLPGMGGLDIFKTTKTKSGYKDPINMRAPYNSGGDDFGFLIDKYKPVTADDTILMSGYFASNRAGGKGSDDIYRFEEKWINLFVLKGKVVEKNFEQPENPDSKMLGLKNVTKAKIELRNTDDNLIATTLSDTGGNFTFKLEAETSYKLAVSKNGYFNNNSTTLSTKGKKNQDSTLISIYAQVELEKIFPSKEIVIPNIYYDYDKATLRPESQLVLDSILIFFKENPDLKIEIGSHTDSRGSDAYNLKLSQARAQSVVDYLISKNIPNETLQAKGYGETKPTNNCVNGAKCTEEEFQKNRRTTFRVVSSKMNLESIEPENIIVDPKKD